MKIKTHIDEDGIEILVDDFFDIINYDDDINEVLTNMQELYAFHLTDEEKQIIVDAYNEGKQLKRDYIWCPHCEQFVDTFREERTGESYDEEYVTYDALCCCECGEEIDG